MRPTRAPLAPFTVAECRQCLIDAIRVRDEWTPDSPLLPGLRYALELLDTLHNNQPQP